MAEQHVSLMNGASVHGGQVKVGNVSVSTGQDMKSNGLRSSSRQIVSIMDGLDVQGGSVTVGSINVGGSQSVSLKGTASSGPDAVHMHQSTTVNVAEQTSL